MYYILEIFIHNFTFYVVFFYDYDHDYTFKRHLPHFMIIPLRDTYHTS